MQQNYINVKYCFGESATHKQNIHESFKHLQESREIEDEFTGGLDTSTTDVNMEKVREMIINNRPITIREAILITQQEYWGKVHGFALQ